MMVAGTGAGSEADTRPVTINDVLGTKFKAVTGYLGTQETIWAIERGRVFQAAPLGQPAGSARAGAQRLPKIKDAGGFACGKARGALR